MNTHRILSVMMILAMVASLCVVAVAPAGAQTATQVVSPTVALSDSAAGVVATTGAIGATGLIGQASAPTTYTIQFITPTLLTAGAAGDKITITFPAYTTIPATASWVTATNLTVNSAAHGTTNEGTNVTVLGQSIVIGLTGALNIAAGEVVTVTINNTPGAAAEQVLNTSVLGAQTLKIRTTQDTVDATSNAFSIYGIAVTGFTTGFSCPANTALTVTGRGYTPGTAVDLQIGGANINQATVAADGTFTGTLNATAAAGITAVDGMGVSYNTVGPIVLIPGLTVSPATALPGATITVTGTGFPVGAGQAVAATTFGGAAIACTFVAIPNESYTTSTVAATAGGISNTGKFRFTCTVPAGSGGVKMLGATDNNIGGTGTGAVTGSGTFTAQGATATISPTSGPAGTTVVVTGAGFQASELVQVQFPVATVLKTVRADAAGNVSTSIAIAIGSVTGSVRLVGQTSTQIANATFTISEAALAVSPAMGAAGSTATVTGTALVPSTSYDIIFTDVVLGVGSIMKTVSTDSLGAFSTTVNIPTSTAGANTIGLNPATVTAIPFTTVAGTVTVAVVDGLTSIDGKFTKVWTFDGPTQEWLLYDVEAGTNDISALTQNMALWLQVTEDTNLVYGGNVVPLYEGWNNIGWPG